MILHDQLLNVVSKINLSPGSISTPNITWENLESMFGKHNEIQGHQLENEFLSLNPNDFSCIQDYLSKCKTLRLLCEE